MKTIRSLAFVSTLILVLSQAVLYRAAGPEKKPIELDDIMAWKGISSPTLSQNGMWFAYRLTPGEGNGDVIIRQTKGEKLYKFGIGEEPEAPLGAPAPGGQRGQGGGAALVAFSSDGKYAAFMANPTKAEQDQLRRQRKPVETHAGIVNLETGEKIDVARVRRFAFSGENPGWVALQKLPPAAAPGGAPAGGAAGAAGAAGANARDDRPRGSDLLLRELATTQEINIGNVADFAFDKPGKYLAWTVDAQDKSGNGVQYRDMNSGTNRSIDSDDKAVYSRLAWTDSGDALAVLKGVDDKNWEEKLYSVIGFRNFGANGPQKLTFDPTRSTSFPSGMTISPNRNPIWTKDLTALTFGIHKNKKKEAPAPGERGAGGANADAAAAGPSPTAAATTANDTAPEDKVDLVIWNYKDPRLQSEQIVQEAQDKNFSFLAEYRPAEEKFIRLADDNLKDVAFQPEQKYAVGRNNLPYELTSHLDGQAFADVYAIDLGTGERKLAVKKSRWTDPASPDGTRFVYYTDGQYWIYDMAAGKATNITAGVPTSFINTEDDHNLDRPPVPMVGWSSDSKSVLLSDNWDVWQVPVTGGAGGKAINLTADGKKEKIRYRRPFVLDPEQKGYDLTKPLYLDAYGEWTKKNGIAVIQPGKPGANRIMWEEASYGTLMKAEKSDVYLYTRQTFQDPPDFFVTDSSIAKGTKITDLAAQQEPFLWTSGTILVDYVSDKGDKLQGALHLPANYEKGKQYPTVVYFYEKMSNNAFQYARPTANGFNLAYYTSNGYAVFNPDITYKLNDPGMSAVWCMVPAVKAAIATGVVDPKHVGIQGHSWGGYQTAFMITQTDIFAAAAAGAPLTDMISMYGIIYKNTGVTNGEIFEASQGRFTSGPWENWDAYTRNSPVAQAAKVKTPLLMLSDDKDGAVDFTQGMEYYNTLRRMGKPVVLLEYLGENHNLAKKADQKDYTVRMKEFFDHYLMGKPSPKWYEDGVPRLDMDDYMKSLKPKAATPAKAP